MASAVASIWQGITYRGKEGHYAWLLHRVGGLGIMAFLLLHILDIFLVGFGPEVFGKFLILYTWPPFKIARVGLDFRRVLPCFQRRADHHGGLLAQPLLELEDAAQHVPHRADTDLDRVHPGGDCYRRAVVWHPHALVAIRGVGRRSTMSALSRGNRPGSSGRFEVLSWYFMRVSGAVLLLLAVLTC